MSPLVQHIIDQIIIKQSFINNYPKPGVAFLNIDHLFNDPISKKMVSDAVLSAINPKSFDLVAGIASRGYIFSGIIANHFAEVGEQFIQKVKSKGDSHFVQIDTTTEYSSDALQVLKNTVQKGKRYLLTDDLIATGGSVLTAIKLIRQCGGQVDTVFVMTELLDFDAREKLKKEGVELISLLQFSNKDLQKLLLIQDAYAESPSTPISYKLTHYANREQAIKPVYQTLPLTVHLASHSAIKKEATQLAFAGLFDPLPIELVEHTAKSGVNDQPFDYEETLRGACNRIDSIEGEIEDLEKSIRVAIENGIRYSEEDKCYYDFVQIIVKKADKTYSHIQDCCVVPAEIIKAISQKDHSLQETWGDVAKRMGMAKNANDPHQEACFGGISRTKHVFQAVCKALGKLKEDMLQQTKPKVEAQEFSLNQFISVTGQACYSIFVLLQKALLHFISTLYQAFATLKEQQSISIPRLVTINTAKENDALKGILFAPTPDSMSNKAIDLYNHGCPIQDWNTTSEQVKRTEFKIFSTGDAFSILSPEVEINGANIRIHVGLEHEHYSPLVLLQEALQLCRSTYEHGAKDITIALPEQFHPVLYSNDFNVLLMDLFKASGANKIYFYDENYKGTLDATHYKDTITLKLAEQADREGYQISRGDLSSYLHLPSVRVEKNEASLDKKVLQFTRKSHLNQAWTQCGIAPSTLDKYLGDKSIPEKIEMSTLQVRPHILLCCSANKPLAKKIAADLRAHGELVQVYHVHGKGEHALIPEEARLCGAVITIVQSTRPNPDHLEESKEYQINGASSYLFEAAMIARQARLRGAERINLINPYQFSARSDKAENNPKGKTGAYVQQNGMLLEAAGVNHVITAECHDTHTMSGSYTGKNIRGSAVSALSIMSTRLASEWIDDPKRSLNGQLRLVTPDAGATKRTKELTAQLQAILGKKLCESRILGEKHRDSHQDNSALINSLNSGTIDINADDKYLITDDETATGSTLCQAITNLKLSGAKDISVLVVHNNMPLDWLSRQLCLARFLYLGANDLHFSDTQEMGSLAKSYEDLISSYGLKARISPQEMEEQVFSWFKKNAAEHCSEEDLNQEFERFKSVFGSLQTKIRVHSLAAEFAKQVRTAPYVEEQLTDVKEQEKREVASAPSVYASSKGSLLFFPQPVKTPRSQNPMPEQRSALGG